MQGFCVNDCDPYVDNARFGGPVRVRTSKCNRKLYIPWYLFKVSVG